MTDTKALVDQALGAVQSYVQRSFEPLKERNAALERRIAELEAERSTLAKTVADLQFRLGALMLAVSTKFVGAKEIGAAEELLRRVTELERRVAP